MLAKYYKKNGIDQRVNFCEHTGLTYDQACDFIDKVDSMVHFKNTAAELFFSGLAGWTLYYIQPGKTPKPFGYLFYTMPDKGWSYKSFLEENKTLNDSITRAVDFIERRYKLGEKEYSILQEISYGRNGNSAVSDQTMKYIKSNFVQVDENDFEGRVWYRVYHEESDSKYDSIMICLQTKQYRSLNEKEWYMLG